MIKVDEATYEQYRDFFIIDLGLSNRAKNCLLRAGIFTVGLLLDKTREELMAIPNMGAGSLEDIETRLTLLINNGIQNDTDSPADSTPVFSEKRILDSDNEIFDEIPIAELKLSTRANNAMIHRNIRYIGQLRDVYESDLYQMQGLGSGSVKEIINAVAAFIEQPVYKYATLDNIDLLGEEFFDSEEFHTLVEDKIKDMLVSNEDNSMSFLDIQNGFGAAIPESAITETLEKLVEKGTLSFSDDAYHFEYPSIVDAIQVLPGKYREVISLKLQGYKYAEIAEKYGVTRSRAQQIAAKGMAAIFRGAKGIAPIKRVKEEDYRELFQTYYITLEEWVTYLKKPELAYRYLSMKYKRGEKPLPGVKLERTSSREVSSRPVVHRTVIASNGTLEDFLEYYKNLAEAQRDIKLYVDEEQYTKEITKLCKRINREIKRKKYISDIRITDQDYQLLRGYLHYAVIMLNKTNVAPDAAMFAAAVTNVAIKTYKEGNFWGNFFKEIATDQRSNTQRNIGVCFYNVLEKNDLVRVDAGEYVQNILLHCFVSDYYSTAYFDFLFNFYRIDLDRDISRLDTDTMRALMDSICAEENVGRTYMLVQHIGQAMAANRRGATIRIRNHMKLLDKFFWDDSFEINTTHRINNLMQKWARSSKDVIGEMEAYSTGRKRGSKRFASPYIEYDQYNQCSFLVIPAQSIKRVESEEIYWRVTGGINRTLDMELTESVIGYKVLESRWEIPIDTVLSTIQLELTTAEGETIKRFVIKGTDVRFFDEEGYPVNSKNIKVGEVVSISHEDVAVRSSALYETQTVDGMLLSFFHFEYEDILHLPNGHVVIIGRPEITNSIAGKGRVEGAKCYFDDKEYDLYGNVPYLVLRMRAEKFPGTAVMINGKRYRLNDLDYASFSLDDRSDDTGYYIDLASYLGQNDDVYRIAVDIPGGSSPRWEFVYIKGFEVSFEESPYVFEPRGTVLFPDHIKIKDVADSCEKEPGVNGYKFVIKDVGRTFDFSTEVGGHDVDLSVPVPAFFIKDSDGNWNSNIPAPVWHADLPDVIDLTVPHHNITLYMDDVFGDSGDSEREITYRRNSGDDHILCDITKFKSYLSGDDIARQLRMRFGEIDSNLFTIIIHSKVISLQIIGDFENNAIMVNADISGKASYYVDIRKDDDLLADKEPLIDGTARIEREIANGIYEVEVFELVEDESGFGGEDYYSIGVYKQEMINPYDMSDRSCRIIQIEEKNDPNGVLPLKNRFNIFDLKGTEDKHLYNGMMVVKKSFYQGSEIASLPVTVRFDDLNRPNYAWVSFIDDEYGDEMDFLYDTRKQGILQEENPTLKPLVCYRRYTVLNDEEYVYHIDFIEGHYLKEYDELSDLIEYPETDTKIVFKDHKYDSKRKRYEVNEKAGRGNIHFSSAIVFVGDAPLSSKTKMCLRDARIQTLNELTKMTKAELADRSTASIKMINEIDRALAQYGMSFKNTKGE